MTLCVTGPPDRILEVWDPEWIPSWVIWDDNMSLPDFITKTPSTNPLLISVPRCVRRSRWYLPLRPLLGRLVILALSELILHTLSARALPDLAPWAITQTDSLGHTGHTLCPSGSRRLRPPVRFPCGQGQDRRGGPGAWRMPPPHVRRANAHQTASNRAQPRFPSTVVGAGLAGPLSSHERRVR